MDAPQPRFSKFSLSLCFSLLIRALPFVRNRAGISPTREAREKEARDSRVSPPGYASSFRPQRTRRWRRRVWDQPGPLHFRSSPSAGSTAALSSVDRASPCTSPQRFPRARLLFTHIPPWFLSWFLSFSFLRSKMYVCEYFDR